MRNPTPREAENIFNDFIDQSYDIIESKVSELVSDFEAATPVKTGDLRDSFEIKTTKNKISIINNKDYAHHILINGKSDQLPFGIMPVLYEFLGDE